MAAIKMATVATRRERDAAILNNRRHAHEATVPEGQLQQPTAHRPVLRYSSRSQLL